MSGARFGVLCGLEVRHARLDTILGGVRGT